MIKKILTIVGLLTIFGIVGMVFLFNKFESTLKEKEPELRQYITMTVEEQNNYVAANIDKLMENFLSGEGKFDYQKMKQDPELNAALINYGRSMVSTFIVTSQFYKELDTDTQAKIKSESDQREIRNAKLQALFDKYDTSKK